MKRKGAKDDKDLRGMSGCLLMFVFVPTVILVLIINKIFGLDAPRESLLSIPAIISTLVSATHYVVARIKKGSALFTWSSFKPFLFILYAPACLALAWLLTMNNGIVQISGGTVYTSREPAVTYVMGALGAMLFAGGLLGVAQIITLVFFSVDFVLTSIVTSLSNLGKS